MSVLFQFEKTIENAIVDFLVANGINAHPGRNVETISRNSVEAIFEYGGAMEEPRQTLNGKIEYNAHEGTISLLVSTTREEGNDHNETLGKVRQLFLNSRNGLSAIGYNFLDLLPLGSVTTEQEEGNQDATVLQYTLKYLIDLNIPTAPPAAPSNIDLTQILPPNEPLNILVEEIPQGLVLGGQVRLLKLGASDGRNLPVGTIVEIVGGQFLSDNTKSSIHFKTDLDTGNLSQTWFSSIAFEGTGWELV